MDNKRDDGHNDQIKDPVLLNQQELEKWSNQLEEKTRNLNSKELVLQQREEALNNYSIELDKRHQDQESKRLEIERGLPTQRKEYFAEHEAYLLKQQEELKQLRMDLDSQLSQLKIKQEELARIQEKVDADFIRERLELQEELQKVRFKAIEELNNEILKKKETAHKELENELQQYRDELDRRSNRLKEQEAKLQVEQNDVLFAKQQVHMLQESLEQRIAKGIQTASEEFDNDRKQFENERQRLLARIDQQSKSLAAYDELQKELGDRLPEEILRDLTTRREEIERLRERLMQPSKEQEEYYDNHRAEIARLEEDNRRLLDEKRELQRSLDTQEELEYEQHQLQAKYDSLEVRYESVIADNNQLKETLKRVSPAYKDPESIEARMKTIKRPYIQKPPRRRQEQTINELEWLEGIQMGIANYGLQFSRRILCAFHTALKTAEWSPLTVLAGVSGTGKSELPKLYSHFGGLNFINVPVQPNWDSQESMLGYFNSINNSYEAQPMLNFLVQSREEQKDDYPGLSDTLSLVLLDEMNLAHVELYFADFLSKLEQRRGAKTTTLPHIDINLGADMEPYPLSLGRNLLFVGTMNQDETTKSLSDKVIDRGTSIFFPRPNTLHSRKELKSLPEQADLLPLKLWWTEWICTRSTLSDETVKYYKQIVEKINEYLGADGKALGHRVWQSIEYYMVNHPLVLGLDQHKYPDEYKEALKFAFEDQLVQKIMPKLRGIETRGYAKENCLDPIRDLLAHEKLYILDDFDRAMRVGYGQFNWVSADYLNNEQSNDRYEELFKRALPVSEQEFTQGV